MRLTKKSAKLGYCLRHSSISANKCWNKLGQLEDIEEELGIDLITLLKALKHGVYVSNDKHNIGVCYVGLAYNFEPPNKRWSLLGFVYGYEAEEWLYPEDYGKTWALTKEELL